MNSATTHYYDLCFAWNWEYDADFSQFLATASERDSLSLLQVTPANLETTVQALKKGEIYFRSLFDRASDGDLGFMPLVEWAQAHDIPCINCFQLARHAINKASCHLDFITAGLYTPYTIILPTFLEQPEIPSVDLRSLGALFAIKPSHGGGGDGVIVEATTWEQVLAARRQYPEDHYLLQAHISAVLLDGREAWFRVIGCAGQVYPCWWDTRTHIYSSLTAEDEIRYGLHSLRVIPQTIGRMYGLELFSTEIAYTAEGLFVVVDYVNDPIDLRLQSKTLDGIPDAIVVEIAKTLVGYVKLKIAAREEYIMKLESKSIPNIQQAVPFLGVVNIDESIHYYVEGLGFEMTKKWIDEGKLRWCWLQREGAALMLQEFRREGHDSWAPKGKVGEGVSICFICADALAIYHEVRSRGISASKPLVGNGMWVTSLSDPDGYRLDFESYTDVPEGSEYSE